MVVTAARTSTETACPCRYIITNEDIMVCASEVGALYIEPEKVISKGHLKPGRILLIDTVEGRVVDDKELKQTTARKQNFASWVKGNRLQLSTIVKRVQRTMSVNIAIDDSVLATDPNLLAFGHTAEQLHLLMLPMVSEDKEALGSMGNDAPLACMATQARPIYDSFRQLFA
ncbi:glutamate synthase [NADH] [Ceratobasidium sp. UAMH 11750]|nr:glutamate synthase [NADH] [Ceratobasidium sp. UAMH 11750]